jgi:hypothetical protein
MAAITDQGQRQIRRQMHPRKTTTAQGFRVNHQATQGAKRPWNIRQRKRLRGILRQGGCCTRSQTSGKNGAARKRRRRHVMVQRVTPP